MSRETLLEMLRCCEAWGPDVCIMGNVRCADAAHALRAALAESDGAEPVEEEVIGEHSGASDRRESWSAVTWIYPGDTVVVRRAAAPAREAESAVKQQLTTELSDEELMRMWVALDCGVIQYARAVLAAARGRG